MSNPYEAGIVAIENYYGIRRTAVGLEYSDHPKAKEFLAALRLLEVAGKMDKLSVLSCYNLLIAATEEKAGKFSPTGEIAQIRVLLEALPDKESISPDRNGGQDEENTMEDITRSGFAVDLTKLIDHHSIDNACGTEDFILADYVVECLSALEKATKRQEEWLNRPERVTVPPSNPPGSLGSALADGENKETPPATDADPAC